MKKLQFWERWLVRWGYVVLLVPLFLAYIWTEAYALAVYGLALGCGAAIHCARLGRGNPGPEPRRNVGPGLRVLTVVHPVSVLLLAVFFSSGVWGSLWALVLLSVTFGASVRAFDVADRMRDCGGPVAGESFGADLKRLFGQVFPPMSRDTRTSRDGIERILERGVLFPLDAIQGTVFFLWWLPIRLLSSRGAGSGPQEQKVREEV